MGHPCVTRSILGAFLIILIWGVFSVDVLLGGNQSLEKGEGKGKRKKKERKKKEVLGVYGSPKFLVCT